MNNLITKKITIDILIGDLVEKYPDLASILMEDYGFHCVGCMGSAYETLEEGATVHGMTADDIEVMVENLNELAEESAVTK